jgi:hypothetical protein
MLHHQDRRTLAYNSIDKGQTLGVASIPSEVQIDGNMGMADTSTLRSQMAMLCCGTIVHHRGCKSLIFTGQHIIWIDT